MIPVAIDMIKSLDSITLPIPVTDESGVRILQKMSRYPPISDNKEIINRRGELDLTANADILSRNSKQPLLVRGDNIERFVNRDPDDSKKICRVGSNFFK